MTPPQTDAFEQISQTAFMTSLARQFTDIPYTKEIARFVEAQRAARFAVILEARYKAINQMMKQYPFTQILELASGFLPRGLTLSADPQITFIESDLPVMVRNKEQLAQQLVGTRPNLHFLEIDATSRPNPLFQCNAYFKAEQPVLALCEGLLMYLTMDEKIQVCANVRELLQQYGGVWITPDFTSTMGLRESQQENPALQQQLQTLTKLTGRSLSDNAFASLDEVRQFAHEQGFRLSEYSMLNVIKELSCLTPLHIDPETARKMLTTQAVFALTIE